MCHSLAIFLSSVPLYFHIKGNVPFLFLRELLQQEKALLRAASHFLCAPAHPVYHMYLCLYLFFTPIIYSVSVSAEEITQIEEGTCHLTLPFITVGLWLLYAASESAAKGWDSKMTEWGICGIQKMDSCSAFGILSDILLACLSACHLWPSLVWVES